jgi:hypothetical protein
LIQRKIILASCAFFLLASLNGCSTAGLDKDLGKAIYKFSGVPDEIGLLAFDFLIKNSKWPKSIEEIRAFAGHQKLDFDLQNYIDSNFIEKPNGNLVIKYQYKDVETDSGTLEEEVSREGQSLNIKTTGKDFNCTTTISANASH